MEERSLEQIGFTNGESRVYLALLEIGETTTGAIIKKSKITGSKVYEILERLIQKGLVSYVIKEKTKYFHASSPKRILDYMAKRELEFKNQENLAKSIISQIEKKQKLIDKEQGAWIYEGYEGIKTVFSLILDSLKQNEEYYAFSIGEELKDEQVMSLLLNYHQKRISKNVKAKIIAIKGEEDLFNDIKRLKGIQIKYLQTTVPLGVFIFKDYVATFSFNQKPTCYLIKNQQIANSYSKFFLSLWEE
jgi:sugar-specific transcriptional regulator TrmB